MLLEADCDCLNLSCRVAYWLVMDIFKMSMTSSRLPVGGDIVCLNDVWVAGEVESTSGSWRAWGNSGHMAAGAGKAAPPVGQFVAAVHIWSLFKPESGVKGHV